MPRGTGGLASRDGHRPRPGPRRGPLRRGFPRWGPRRGRLGGGPPLLPGRLRPVAAALLAVCAAVTVFLGAQFAGQSRPGRLDSAVDGPIIAAGRHIPVLSLLALLGDAVPVTVMALALVVGCAARRRWRAAVLAAVAVPAAAGLTEGLLKPLTGRMLHGALSYPSGHATSTFSLAAVCVVLLAAPPRRRAPVASPEDPGRPRGPASRVALEGRPSRPTSQRSPGERSGGLARAARLLAALAALAVAAAVSAAMVALGFHYFTDAIGGAGVGTGVVLLAALIVDEVPRRASRPGGITQLFL